METDNNLYFKKDNVLQKINGHYICTKCLTVHSYQSWAEYCCKDRYCLCGKEIEYFRALCSTCSMMLQRTERLSKATEVKYIGQELYSPINDSYYLDLDSLKTWYKNLTPQAKQKTDFWFFATIESEWDGLDIETILENSLDDHHEDAIDQVNHYDSLKEFLDVWNKEQSISSFYPDFTKKINVKAFLTGECFDCELNTNCCTQDMVETMDSCVNKVSNNG